MRSAIALVGVTAQLAGCELVFPLDDDKVVTGVLIDRRASNGPNNAISVEDIPESGATFQIRYESGDTFEGTVAEDGTFRFPKRGATYAFITDINSNQAEVLESSDTLSLALHQAGRDNVAPITAPTPISLPSVLFPPTTTPPAPPNTNRLLATVGQWTNQPANQTSFTWTGTGGTGTLPIGLIDARQHDVVFLLEQADDMYIAGQRAIGAVGSDDGVIMTAGTEVDLTGIEVEPVVQNDCVTFSPHLAGEAARMVEAFGPGWGPPAVGFALLSVPSATTGFAGALALAGGDSPLDIEFDVPAHDPFPGQATLGSISIFVGREITVPNKTVSRTVFSGSTMLVEAPRGVCPSNRISFDALDMAYAGSLRVEDQLLEADAQEVTVRRPGGAEVTWTAEGRADFFDVALLEVLERIDGGVVTLAFEPRRQFRTHEQRVEIDDTLLLPGHFYVVQVTTVIGFPDAATGDYANLVYPNSSATLTSNLFIAR